MSVTVVVGGQFGSEGKGKVAQYLAAERGAAAAVRVGGSNSGHTGYTSGGTHILRHLPTASLLPDPPLCLLGAGSYIDVPTLLAELELTSLPLDRFVIDENAMVITDADREYEQVAGLRERIGSTGSGTGGAVRRRVDRHGEGPRVSDVDELRPYVDNVSSRLRDLLRDEQRVIVEGTQGFGLSVLHAPAYPYATSRDTTAAAALSEAGLSPRDADEVVLVLRAFPIRVAGNSGPLPDEIDWDTIAAEGGTSTELREYTSVTGRLRRVAHFDPEVVRRAITANDPSLIVLNHVDYVDARCSEVHAVTEQAHEFIEAISASIGAPIALVGIGPSAMLTFGRARSFARP